MAGISLVGREGVEGVGWARCAVAYLSFLLRLDLA